jgi:23S rRNA (pseudouridine1915-N3)-methyltransferase
VRLLVLAMSHRQPAWVNTAFAEYAKRMPREARVELVELKPEARPDNAGPAAVSRLLDREGQRILAAVPAGAECVALDEHGTMLDSRGLAGLLRGWLAQGRDVAFVIGSADGLGRSVLDAAHRTISLSRMTLPHGLVRVMLAEQLYRAHALVCGHPYHRD